MQSIARRGLVFAQQLIHHYEWVPHGMNSQLRARGLHSTAVTMNWFSKRQADGQAQREQQVFDAQMKFFLDRSNGSFDGDVYMRFLETLKSAGGFTGITGQFNQNNPALQELNEKMTILSSMTPAERTDPTLLHKGKAPKRRITQASGFDLEKVEDTIDAMEMYGLIQEWVRKRDETGEVLPKNSAELQGMIRVPGQGLRQKPPRRRSIKMSPGLGHTIRRKYFLRSM